MRNVVVQQLMAHRAARLPEGVPSRVIAVIELHRSRFKGGRAAHLPALCFCPCLQLLDVNVDGLACSLGP